MMTLASGPASERAETRTLPAPETGTEDTEMSTTPDTTGGSSNVNSAELVEPCPSAKSHPVVLPWRVLPRDEAAAQRDAAALEVVDDDGRLEARRQRPRL
jgi:hypothetical protein